MDNSTQLGVDDRSGLIFCGIPVLTIGDLLSLLGADTAGTQRGILVLPRRCYD
jgi:hypothetical protein